MANELALPPGAQIVTPNSTGAALPAGASVVLQTMAPGEYLRRNDPAPPPGTTMVQGMLGARPQSHEEWYQATYGRPSSGGTEAADARVMADPQGWGAYEDYIVQVSPEPVNETQRLEDLARTRTTGEYLGERASMALQGATAGWSDELAGTLAGIGAWLQGEPWDPAYTAARDAERDQLGEFRRDDPQHAGAFEVAGAVPTALIPFGAATRGAGVGTKALVGGALAGGQGAVYGAGGADPAPGEGGWADRGQDALRTGLFAGGLGAAVPGIAAALPALARSGRRAVDSVLNPEQMARNTAARTMTDAAATVEPAINRLRGNPRLMPADVDPNLEQLLQGAASQPGPAKGVATTALRTRAGTAADAVTEAFNRGTGTQAADPGLILQGLKDSRAATANQMFGGALRQVDYVDAKPALDAISASGGVSAQARSYLDDIATRIGDAGGNPEALHRIQSEMGATIRDLTLQGGWTKADAQQIERVRQAIVGQIDAPTGGAYRAAQAQFADDIETEQAFWRGFDILKNPRQGQAALDARPEELARWVAKASQAQLEAARAGARAAFDQAMLSTRNAARTGTAIADVGFNQQRMAVLFGADEAAQMARELSEETAMAATLNRVLNNAQTAEKTAGQEATRVPAMGGPLTLGGAAANLAGYQIINGQVIPALVTAGTGAAVAAGRGVQRALARKRNEHLARLLTRQGPEGEEALRSIAVSPYYGRSAQIDARTRAIIDSLLSPTNRAATPALLTQR